MDLFKNRPIDLDFIWLEQFSTYSSMYFNIVCSSASISKPKCCPDQGCTVKARATLSMGFFEQSVAQNGVTKNLKKLMQLGVNTMY